MARVSKVTDKGISDLDINIDDVRQVYNAAKAEHLGGFRDMLLRLWHNPPQVLLLEGGSEDERQSMALWWAALQHCKNNEENPCGVCSDCLHVGARIHSDILSYDGRISNTADAESPGPVRAFTMDNVRELKKKLRDSTRSEGKRVVIIEGIGVSRNNAANALLKVLEEPSASSIFVLLTPLREQILPTLISRSWVATLPWTSPYIVQESLRPWEESLAVFLQRGQGLWQVTSTKNAITLEIAAQIISLCQKRLVTSLDSGQNQNSKSSLTSCFSALSAEKRLNLSQKLDQAQRLLHYNVTPVRVIENLAAHMWLIYRG